MILLSLPFPPIPVVAGKVVGNETVLEGDDTCTTTHSLIAILLNANLMKNDPQWNRERRSRQVQLFREFLQAMAETGFELDGEPLYKFYCHYSLEHIKTYFPPEAAPGVVFLPLHSICKNDKAHQKMCEYMAAQAILFEEDTTTHTRDYFEPKEFIELLKLSRARLGHTASPAELDKIHELNSISLESQEGPISRESQEDTISLESPEDP